jgi:hypothetical protein
MHDIQKGLREQRHQVETLGFQVVVELAARGRGDGHAARPGSGGLEDSGQP